MAKTTHHPRKSRRQLRKLNRLSRTLSRDHTVGPDDRPNMLAEPVNVVVASHTDPDAGLVSRPGVPLGLYHKLHVGVDDGRARIITGRHPLVRWRMSSYSIDSITSTRG